MDNVKAIKEQMISVIQGQMCNLENVDVKELGEAVDIVKDLAETAYYCSITEAMEESKKEPQMQSQMMYQEPRYYTRPREDYDMGRMYYGGDPDWYGYEPMYYGGNGGNSGMGSSAAGRQGGSRYYTPRMMPEWNERPHDIREGRSYNSRRMYMESKEMHKDQGTQMKELEKYIQDLGLDITEMIKDATPEEKQVLQQKIATLASKIV